MPDPEMSRGADPPQSNTPSQQPPKPNGEALSEPSPDAAPKPASGKEAKAKAYKPPADAADMASLFVDTGQGDPLTEAVTNQVTVGKPKDFFRVHPDLAYRQRCFVYTLKVEGQVEEQNFIVDEPMRGLVPEARLCLVTTYVYRDGTTRLWLLWLPREGEKDYTAWASARAAAKDALAKWTKIVWLRSKYDAREAQPGYAPEPDWTKLPSFERLIELAFGAHGVMRDETHPVYRDHVIGAAKKSTGDDLA
jgi:hypothetical protein